MIERQISAEPVIAGAAWAVSGALLLAAWGLLAIDDTSNAAALMANTACVVAAVATVKTIRCYTIRVCELLRNVTRDAQPSGPPVPIHRIH